MRTKHERFVVAGLLLVGQCATFSASGKQGAKGQQALRIAEQGQALVKIAVDSANATPAEETAAKELAAYLGRITGGKFDVVEEKDLAGGKPAIYVGNTAFADAAALHTKDLGSEESVIKTVAGSLILTGGRPRGTLYAVFLFLEEELGCRWYTIWDERVPHRPALVIGRMDRRSQPAFPIRDLYAQSGDMRGKPGGWQEFCVRNRIALSGGVGAFNITEPWGGPGMRYGPPGACHTFNFYLNPKDYVATHPEYCSEWAGTRHVEYSDQFCLTNPDVRKIVLEKLRDNIRKNPDATVFDVSQNDGNQQRCQCANCQAIEKREEAMSGPLIDFINYLADGIKEEFPNIRLLTFAYNWSRRPPKTLTVRDNVGIRYCLGIYPHLPTTAPANQFIADEIQQWRRKCKHLWIWDYDFCGHSISDPYPSFDSYADRFRLFQRLNAEYIFEESEYLSFVRQLVDLKHWVVFKLMEDPGRDVWQLVDDFANGVYGAAGPCISKYVRLLEKRKEDWPYRLFDQAFLVEAQRLFDQAERATAKDPAALTRIREARYFLDLTTLKYWSKACTEFVRAGNDIASWPLSKEAILARTVGYYDALLAEKRWLIDHPYCKDFRDKYVAPILRSARMGRAVMPLPKELAGIPPQRIIELPVQVLNHGGYPVVEDKEAADGTAVRVERTEAIPFDVLPFSMGVYDHLGLAGGGRRINPSDIPGPGYHLYRMGQQKLSASAYIWLTNSWQIQIPTLCFADPKRPEEAWDIYASIRLENPAAPTEKQVGLVDRVILVNPAQTE